MRALVVAAGRERILDLAPEVGGEQVIIGTTRDLLAGFEVTWQLRNQSPAFQRTIGVLWMIWCGS